MTSSVARSQSTIAGKYSLAGLTARTAELLKAVFWSGPREPDPRRHQAVKRDAYMESAAMRREMYRL